MTGIAVQGLCTPSPLGATLSGLSERKSCRLTISATRTDVALFIHRAVRPSGIPAAVVHDHGAVVSTSFPSRLRLDGFPAPPAKYAQNLRQLIKG